MASKNTQKILIIVGVVALVLVLVCGGGAYGIYAWVRSTTEVAEKVIVDFHENYNKKDYQAIFNSLHPALQEEVPLDKLTEMLDYVHARNGRFVSNSGTGWNFNSTNGVTVYNLSYSVKFARDNGAENFELVDVNGRPRITLFNIQTPNLESYGEE